MVPGLEAIGFVLALVFAAVILFAYLLVNIKNQKRHRVFIAASLCGVVAFISFTVWNHRFSLFASLILGFCMGFLAGAVWSATVQFIGNIIPLKKYNWFPGSSQVWWSGVLPSNVYLGYMVATLNLSFWWLKLLLILFAGYLLVLLSKAISLKSGKSTASADSAVSLKTSAVLWVPLIMAIIFCSVSLWF